MTTSLEVNTIDGGRTFDLVGLSGAVWAGGRTGLAIDPQTGLFAGCRLDRRPGLRAAAVPGPGYRRLLLQHHAGDDARRSDRARHPGHGLRDAGAGSARPRRLRHGNFRRQPVPGRPAAGQRPDPAVSRRRPAGRRRRRDARRIHGRLCHRRAAPGRHPLGRRNRRSCRPRPTTTTPASTTPSRPRWTTTCSCSRARSTGANPTPSPAGMPAASGRCGRRASTASRSPPIRSAAQPSKGRATCRSSTSKACSARSARTPAGKYPG